MADPEPPLRGRSLPELREMLRRQERLLGDRKFTSTLPDSGQKLSAFADKLKVAIAQEEALRRRTPLLHTVRTPFEKRRYGPGSSEFGGILAGKENPTCRDLPRTPDAPASRANTELGSAGQSQPRVWATNKGGPAGQARGGADTFRGTDDVPEREATSRLPFCNPHRTADLEEDSARPTNRSRDALVGAFEGLSVAGTEHEGVFGEEPTVECRETPSQGIPHQTPKMPQRAHTPMGKQSPFKPNRIPAELSGSSEAPSPGGRIPPVSAAESRHRKKQDLRDISAARLPVLHHASAQLLPIDQSIGLQVQQKTAYEEMQAKLAAQKLAEKLGVTMVAYEPEGEAGISYRQEEDEEGCSSTDD